MWGGWLAWLALFCAPPSRGVLPYGDPAQIGAMARTALRDSLRRNDNVFIGWQGEDPDTTPASEVEAAIAKLWPVTTVVPARAFDGDWCMHSFGESATLSYGAVERTIDDFISTHFPNWQPGAHFRPHAFVLRHDTTAEMLGLIEPHQPTADEICAASASDPRVAAATVRLDRATPASWHELARARLDAQTRSGVPEDRQAALYSSQVDEIMVPLMMRCGRGDEPAVLAHLRRDCRARFGDLSEKIVLFLLRTYRHHDTSTLLALASGSKEAA
jgi:hypothetical protein